MIQQVRAGSATDFRKVFAWLQDFVNNQCKNVTELTVIFFTDGQDTCNNGAVVDSAFQTMKQQLEQKQQIKSRFLSIGFSASHDAKFMNKIALAGQEMGNFFYIDTGMPDYGEVVKSSLTESLDIALEASGALKLSLVNKDTDVDNNLALEMNYEFAENEVQDVDQIPQVSAINLSCQSVVPFYQVEGVQASIMVKDTKHDFAMTLEKVDNPSEDVLLKAKLQSAN